MSIGQSIRERSRRAVRDQIKAVAMQLFVEQGFEATTIDQIAAAAGMSSRTFFRYFATKEDVVIGDPHEFGASLRDALEQRPADEPAPEALVRALDAFVDHVSANPAAVGISTVMLSTPSLRARHIEKQRVWVELLLPGTLARLGDIPHPTLVATALITSTLTVFDAAFTAWAAENGRDDLRELLDTALAAVRGA